MKKLILLAVAVIIFAVLWWSDSRPKTEKLTAGELESPEDRALVVTSQTKPIKPLGVQQDPSSQAPADMLDNYPCRTQSVCGYTALSAESEQEARWLAGRGYPSADQLANLEGASIDELKSKAASGDLVAAAVFGRRLIEMGQTMEGLVALDQAAINGSVYADYVFAEAYLNDTKLRDRTEGAAYLRRAFLQGDWKATAELYQALPDITPLELLAADRRAVRLYQATVSHREKERKPTVLWLRPTSSD